jgi:hypothetical protein
MCGSVTGLKSLPESAIQSESSVLTKFTDLQDFG